MSSCLLTGGFGLPSCRDNTGGIDTIYITNWSNVTQYDLDADEIVTGITMSGTTKFYEYKPNKNSGQFTQTVTVSPENGTVGTEQTITLITSKNEYVKRNLIKLLAQSEMIAIVLDRNGKYFLAGADFGMTLTNTGYDSGKLITDGNSWQLQMVGNEKFPAYEVSASVVASVI